MHAAAAASYLVQHTSRALVLALALAIACPPVSCGGRALDALTVRWVCAAMAMDDALQVCTQLQSSSNFRLRTGERVVRCLAYNHAVRGSGGREHRPPAPAELFGGTGRAGRKQRAAHARTAGRRQTVISDVRAARCIWFCVFWLGFAA